MRADKVSVADLVWVKARKSQGMGMCVEVAKISDSVLIRDSKDPNGHFLRFSPLEFDAFLDGCRRGEFDEIGLVD